MIPADRLLAESDDDEPDDIQPKVAAPAADSDADVVLDPVSEAVAARSEHIGGKWWKSLIAFAHPHLREAHHQTPGQCRTGRLCSTATPERSQ